MVQAPNTLMPVPSRMDCNNRDNRACEDKGGTWNRVLVFVLLQMEYLCLLGFALIMAYCVLLPFVIKLESIFLCYRLI